ncbi:hypothetical protein ABPG74_014439 [Tetrahymena malaccensis]
MNNHLGTNLNQQNGDNQILFSFQNTQSYNNLKNNNCQDHFQKNKDNQYNKSFDTTQLSNRDSYPQTPIKQYKNERPSLLEASNSSLQKSFLEQIGQNFNPQQYNQIQTKESNEEHKYQKEFLKNECDQQKMNNQVIYTPQKQQANQVDRPKRIQESDLNPIKQLIQYYQQSTAQILDKSQVISQANRFLSLIQQNEQKYIEITNSLILSSQTQQSQINALNNSLKDIKSQYNSNLQCKLEIEENEKKLQESNTNLNEQIDVLQKQKSELANQINDCRQYQVLFQQSQQKLENIQKSSKELNNQIQSLNQKCQELENDLQIATQQKIQYKQEIEKLKSDQDIQNFQKQKEFQESMKILQNQIDDLNGQISKLVNQNNYLNQYESMYQQQFKENEKLKQSKKEKQQQIDQNKQQIVQLQNVLEETKQESIKNQKLYEKSIQEQKVQNENITKEFQQVKDNLEQKIDIQQKQMDQLTTQNNNLTKYVELYESSQKNIQKIEQDLNTRSDQLELQKQQTIKLQKELENTVVKRQNEVQELSNKLQQQIDNQNKQTIETNKLNKELIKYQDLYKQSEQNYQQSLHNLMCKDKEIEQLKQQNIKLQKDLENNSQKQQEAVKTIFKELSCSQIKGNDIDKQVEQVLTQLNPQVQIQSNQIQFAKAFSIIEQNKPSDQEKVNLQIKNNQIIEKYKQDQQSSQYQANTSIQNKNGNLDPIQCLLVLQNMYKDDGITTYITDQSIQALQKEENYQQQQSFIQIGLHDQASYFQMKFDKQAALYDELMQTKTKNNLNDFLYKFKSNIIGQKINTQNPQQDVIIMNVAFVQVPQIDFRVVSNQYSNKELKKIITFRDIGVSVSEQSLLESAKLTADMFNPQHNMEWGANYQGKSEARGQLKFYDQPNPVNHIYNFPVGYKGYALDVSKYGNDQSWISQNADSKTWIVLFHGTNQNALSGIMQSNLAPGHRNMYGGHKCRITGTTIKSGSHSNVYLTDSIKVAEGFAQQTTIFNQKKFQIIFQCRVNPSGVKSPINQITYYTVEDNKNIRPYRILLKEC